MLAGFDKKFGIMQKLECEFSVNIIFIFIVSFAISSFDAHILLLFSKYGHPTAKLWMGTCVTAGG